MAERLHIAVVPAYIQINNRSYLDRSSSNGLGREQFYAQLPHMSTTPTTSAPPVADFVQTYRSLLNEADEIVAVMVASDLSGIYNFAQLAAREVPQLKIHVVDSKQVTMGLGWMVIAAAEAAMRGTSASEIVTMMTQMPPRVHVYAMFDTLEYLRRSGRVGWARAKAAQILHIKPVVKMFLGQVTDAGRARTRHRAIDRLVELTRALGPLERLAILHTYAPELEVLTERLADLCAPEHLLTVAATTVIGAHVGPRGLGVAAVTAE
jgi:DegV family protein with EDD domain